MPEVEPFAVPQAETCDYIGPEGVFWSRGPKVLRSAGIDAPPLPFARIPLSGGARILAATRLGRRLGRQSVYNLLPISGGCIFFSFGKRVGTIADGTVHPVRGRGRAARTLRGGAVRLPSGEVAFGEYFDNADRGEVLIHRLAPGGDRVQTAFRFPPGTVRHIHSVSWDPVARRVVVATGDVGNECRLLSFDAGFTECETLGGGDERWRTISPQYAERAIYFGTDAQFRQNHIQRYDRTTGALTAIDEVNGPVFYSAPMTEGWVFATTAELCPSQTSPEAILYYLDATTEKLRVLARFAKDALPRKYFQFGILNLPVVAAPVRCLPVSGTGLVGLDGRFVLIRE